METSERPNSVSAKSDKPVEVGVRFVSSESGTLDGLRFFRGSGDRSRHTATLWTDDGQKVAGLEFERSRTEGWQYAAFSQPVPIEAGQIYVASYHTSSGYAIQMDYYKQDNLTSGPLTALTDTSDSPNGVYKYGDTPVFPDQSWRGSSYFIDVLFDAGADGADPGEPTAPPTTTEPPPVVAEPPPSPSAPPAPTPTLPGAGGGGAVGANAVPEPGQVGFLGDPAQLTVIDSSATAPPGTEWRGKHLHVSNGATLENVYVKGGIDYYGTAPLVVRNSIIEASGDMWSIVMARDTGGSVEITDSTLTWPASVPAPGSSWGNGAIHGDSTMTILRCDISGTPDGVQQGNGNSTFTQNYIHDLRMFGTYPDNTHNDGLQFYGGPGMVVSYNRIELNGYDGTHQNAAVFFSDDGNGFESPQIVGNYLSGGGYQLRLEDGVQNAVVVGNTFGPIAGGFGEVNVTSGATVAQWTDNLTSVGALLNPP